MDPLLPPSQDDANFAHLSNDELRSYFTLTRRISLGGGTSNQSGELGSGTAEPELILPERYSLIRVLARGGLGAVYLAEDHSLGKKVAIKAMPITLAEDPIWRERFERESAVQSAVPHHPNIVSFLESGVARGPRRQAIPFNVIEYVEGSTLEQMLEREKRLSLAQIQSTLLPILGALECLGAAGIVHRDIKPANILISNDGTPKLADFGIAVQSMNQPGTRGWETATIMGTPHFMSPEQLMGELVTSQSDLYSFGVILFEALTGQPAVASDMMERVRQLNNSPPRPSAAAHDVPKQLDEVVVRLLARDPADRYRDASTAKEALMAALRHILDEAVLDEKAHS
jgi:serine/threonine-protein kinase